MRTIAEKLKLCGLFAGPLKKIVCDCGKKRLEEIIHFKDFRPKNIYIHLFK